MSRNASKKAHCQQLPLQGSVAGLNSELQQLQLPPCSHKPVRQALQAQPALRPKCPQPALN